MCEQPVAFLLGIEQPEAGARQRFRAECKTDRVERGGDDAERGEGAMKLSSGNYPLEVVPLARLFGATALCCRNNERQTKPLVPQYKLYI